jgi:ribosomal protein S18 acetylase RimI-like enzyme
VLTVRGAGPGDEIFVLALTERLAAFAVPDWRTAAQVAHVDDAILRDQFRQPNPDNLLLVAQGEAGIRLGFVFARSRRDVFTGRPVVHVETLATEAEAEGRGVGRVLMTAVEDWARDRGASFVTLNVFDTNARARGFYARLGYQPETLHYVKPL